MCGRIALTQPDKEKIKKRFNLTKLPKKELQHRFNISPSQEIPVILNESPQELSLVKWGLVPHWAKEIKSNYSMINARAETICEKPAYRGPIKTKRCLIIVDSFYEWMKTNGHKKPYRILLENEDYFTLAGIWDVWEKGDKPLRTCSIITTSSNELMTPVHDRMPVILPPEHEKEWLKDISLTDALRLLRPYNSEAMKMYEISTMVNSPSADIAEIINPV